jgi:hypothetical protein
MPEPIILPALDSDPEEWGPEHDDLTLTEEEIEAGVLQGERINIDDDEDNGLDEDSGIQHFGPGEWRKNPITGEWTRDPPT